MIAVTEPTAFFAQECYSNYWYQRKTSSSSNESGLLIVILLVRVVMIVVRCKDADTDTY
jgi:hypothetical protein